MAHSGKTMTFATDLLPQENNTYNLGQENLKWVIRGSLPLSDVTGADDLKAIEAISSTSGLLKKNGANTWTLDTNSYVTSSGVTSVATGVGLTGGSITSTGTIKAYLKSEAKATYDSATVTNTSGRQYAVTPDKTGYLSVNVPWTDNNTATATDNILDGSNSGTAITYAPYSAQQNKLSFDTSTTAAPTRTDRLNLNGFLYATKYNVAGEVTLQYNTTDKSLDFIFT